MQTTFNPSTLFDVRCLNGDYMWLCFSTVYLAVFQSVAFSNESVQN